MAIRLILAGLLLLLPSGCAVLPEISRQPTVHNPFPQLTKVAVAPFFNLSTEPTLDGRQVALAYFDALQSVPGFEVVPIGVVEQTLQAYQISLDGPPDARKLAQILEVDALVTGAVTDFSPYYPPRLALHVQWHAANPCFHPIPPGYGLPWGTAEANEIPESLLFEAERAVAKAQLAAETPPYSPPIHLLPPPETGVPWPSQESHLHGQSRARPVQAKLAMPATAATTGATATGLGACPGPPNAHGPGLAMSPAGAEPCVESILPILEHTRTYNGHDADVTAALASYVHFRDEARYGGWKAYLQRSDDFIRFCCHHHISEMLTARGGAGETRVVWHWPAVR